MGEHLKELFYIYYVLVCTLNWQKDIMISKGQNSKFYGGIHVRRISANQISPHLRIHGRRRSSTPIPAAALILMAGAMPPTALSPGNRPATAAAWAAAAACAVAA